MHVLRSRLAKMDSPDADDERLQMQAKGEVNTILCLDTFTAFLHLRYSYRDALPQLYRGNCRPCTSRQWLCTTSQSM